MAKEQQNAPVQDMNQLRKVRREKLAELMAAGKNPFEIVTYDQTEHTQQIKDNYEAYEGKDVSIAGRLMQKRVMGKASFGNVQDLQGNIQIYVARDDLGEEAYKEFKKLDIGDIIGVKGFVFTTQKGEKSIHAKEVTLLSKSLQILPEKFHGLTNTDLRYRQRYVDLIMNPESRDVFVKRSKIISAIREYLNARDFLEVETPMLVENAGGAAARPFTTHFNALNEDKKLRISLELYLKRLIVGGMERVYEITAFLNPTENSYLRLGSRKAPGYISWSSENRSQLIRIPAAPEELHRAELRSADPGVNPYLAFALLIHAGLDGIEEGLPLPPSADLNLFTAPEAVLKTFRHLPLTLREANDAARASAFVSRVLPPEIIAAYCER